MKKIYTDPKVEVVMFASTDCVSLSHAVSGGDKASVQVNGLKRIPLESLHN